VRCCLWVRRPPKRAPPLAHTAQRASLASAHHEAANTPQWEHLRLGGSAVIVTMASRLGVGTWDTTTGPVHWYRATYASSLLGGLACGRWRRGSCDATATASVLLASLGLLAISGRPHPAGTSTRGTRSRRPGQGRQPLCRLFDPFLHLLALLNHSSSHHSQRRIRVHLPVPVRPGRKRRKEDSYSAI
jgi:hypothetical protein